MSVTTRLVGVSTARRWPTCRWWALANFFVRIVPVCPSAASVAAEPCSHSILYIRPNETGSIAVRGLFSSITGAPGLARSRTRPWVKAIAVTVPTPETRRSAGATSAGMPSAAPPLSEFCTIRLPAKDRATAWSMVAFVPAARIEMNATSPSPTVSASAVTSVRPGCRVTFSRARRPTTPRQLTNQPIAPASAGTTR